MTQATVEILDRAIAWLEVATVLIVAVSPLALLFR